MLGERQSPVDISYKSFVALYLLFILFVLFVSGLIFGISCLKSNIDEVKLKGKFIILTAFTWLVGSILDGLMDVEPITLIITRSILIACAALYYIGFLLPESIKQLLLKEN